MIRCEGLARSFGPTAAVAGLDLRVEEGEIFGLVGPDGAGKTTTLRLLAGVLTPSAGGAMLGGFDLVRETEKIREIIAYMPQRFGLYEDLTVGENIDFYAEICGARRAGRREKIAKLLEFTRLGPFEDRLARDLSGGMKQKLGLACALVHTPKILLLDEPTNGVDPVSRRDFWSILYDLLREKVTILYATSYLDEAQRCRRVALMHEGRLLRCDEPEKIRAGFATLEEAFVSIVESHERG